MAACRLFAARAAVGAALRGGRSLAVARADGYVGYPYRISLRIPAVQVPFHSPMDALLFACPPPPSSTSGAADTAGAQPAAAAGAIPAAAAARAGGAIDRMVLLQGLDNTLVSPPVAVGAPGAEATSRRAPPLGSGEPPLLGCLVPSLLKSPLGAERFGLAWIILDPSPTPGSWVRWTNSVLSQRLDPFFWVPLGLPLGASSGSLPLRRLIFESAWLSEERSCPLLRRLEPRAGQLVPVCRREVWEAPGSPGEVPRSSVSLAPACGGR